MNTPEDQTKDSNKSTALTRCLDVGNELGLHARVAARIAETVQRFDCRVMLVKDGVEADGASILSILTLDAPCGSRLTAEASGEQADQALSALEELFNSGFGEGS
jgi:phosphocarrier protein HPr